MKNKIQLEGKLFAMEEEDIDKPTKTNVFLEIAKVDLAKLLMYYHQQKMRITIEEIDDEK